MSLHFPLPNTHFVSHFTLPVSPFLNGNHFGAEIRNEFTLSVAKKIRPLCFDSLKWRDPLDETDLPIEKMNQINTKNYWK